MRLAAVSPRVFPVIPHQTGRDIEHIGDYQFWIEGTLELMRRCDVVFAIRGWTNSKGAVGEVQEANRLGIPVIDGDPPGTFEEAAQELVEAGLARVQAA